MSHRWSRIERQLRSAHGELIAGVDEVGRGPLAGPVVACAVIMPPGRRPIPGVNDSKRLTPDAREHFAVRILEQALALRLAAASSREVDALNVYHASTLAMRRAITRLALQPHHVVIDGRPIRALGIAHTAVVKGDSRCYSIACASIVAKVTRDRLMRRLAVRYPAFGWERNAGYATEEHVVALDRDGGTPHHRTSFRIRQLELGIADGPVIADVAGPSFVVSFDGQDDSTELLSDQALEPVDEMGRDLADAVDAMGSDLPTVFPPLPPADELLRR